LSVFVFRLFFGLCSEFWFEDEKQIYLLGLKHYTTGEWPYFGPDIVYTNSQIPGALQGLLVGLPFHVIPIPEAPFILLNILSLLSLCLLAWYCCQRIPGIPKWFIWVWVFTAPWTMNFSTHINNSSYVLTGAALFFVGFMESYSRLRKGVIPLGWANFMMGFSLFWVFQVHMSWPVLIPFLLASFLSQMRFQGRKFWHSAACFLSGALVTVSLAIPTFLKYGLMSGTGGTGSNIRFNPHNLLEFFTILARFLSFASFELARFLGHNTQSRLEFLGEHPWLTPLAVFVGVVGLLQPLVMIVMWFLRKNNAEDWRAVKHFSLLTFLLVVVLFAFSVKGPASHAFYVVLPVAVVYSFYCWEAFLKNRVWRRFAAAFLLAGILFHIGLALGRAPNKSLYRDRSIPQLALEKKDHRILGERRKGALW